MPFMEISDRDLILKWGFQEPGARLRPWLRELSFWRHDTGTPVNKHGVKLYKALPLKTISRSLADQFRRIVSVRVKVLIWSQVQFVITFDRIWRQSPKYRQK